MKSLFWMADWIGASRNVFPLFAAKAVCQMPRICKVVKGGHVEWDFLYCDSLM